MKLKQLTYKEAAELRKKLYLKQKKKCAVLQKEIDFSDCVLDHKHKRKDQKPGPKGRGLIRGVLDFRVNAFEGIITKKYKRSGLLKIISLPKLLRRLADYLEKPPCKQIYIHPTEREQEILKKREYNKIKKYYTKMYPKRKKGPPGYKKNMKLTKSWKKLLDNVNKYLEE